MSESLRGEADSPSDQDDKESSVCPTCGKELANKAGMRIHHSKAHGESLSQISRECDYCKSVVKVHESRAESNEFFCDMECLKKSKRVFVECSYCHSRIERQKNTIDGREMYFCDLECRGEWISENNVGKSHPRYKESLTIECKHCQKGFEVKPSRSNAVFCSCECIGAWMRENKSGKDSWNWKDDSVDNIYYGPNWKAQRQKALQRDQHRCQRCGDTPNDVGQELDVHHKKKIKWFKENYDEPKWYEKGNDLRNLISFCKSCHRQWELLPVVPDMR